MKFIFNAIYLATLLLFGPWIAVSRMLHGKSIRSWPAKFTGACETPDFFESRQNHQQRFWFHAVSVGEVNLVATIIQRMKRQARQTQFVVTTSTDTGFDLAKTKFPDAWVCYCPWDFSWSVSNFIRDTRPDCLVLAELEIWPNLINVAKQNGLQVIVANGRLSENSFRGYQRLNKFGLNAVTRNVFRIIDLVIAQNETYANRFRRLGVNKEKIQISGSIKFDGASKDRDHPQSLEFKRIADVNKDDHVFLAGSTQAGEDEVVVDAFLRARSKSPQLRLMIAPRHPNRAHRIAEMVRQKGLIPTLRSALDKSAINANADHPETCDVARCPSKGASRWDTVLIIDTVGELSHWWAIAKVAFVGGSLGNRGGQNMIEPSALGCAVCFGPNTRNFRDVVKDLLAARAAKVVHNADELAMFINWSIEKKGQSRQMTQRAKDFVSRNHGATEITINLIQEHLTSVQQIKKPIFDTEGTSLKSDRGSSAA